MNIIDMLMLACLLPLLSLYVWESQILRHNVINRQERTSVRLWTLSITAMALPVFSMCVTQLPLPLFYLMFYITSYWAGVMAKEETSRSWLFTNVRFLIFTAPHLVVVGALALWRKTDVDGILNHFTFRVLSLVIVIILNVVTVPILTRRLNLRHLQGLQWATEELHLFSTFILLCACCIFFDSIPCLFPLTTIFPLLFLIGSNVLLLLMVFLFARHVYTIMRDSHLKEQAIHLHEEALEQHNRTVRLEQEAYLDTLTKLYTRPYVLSNMNSMLRSGEAFALAFLDLDGLKQVNDQQGHLAGDAYLQTFTTHMQEQLRPNDIFARYGGDEFLILMPDLSFEAANAQLSSLQTAASAIPPMGWGVPFSYGLVSAQPGTGKTAEAWISLADQAMYENKERRRAQKKGELS